MRNIFIKKSKRFASLSSQNGAVLIVGLIMVLLITIIGLAAVRGSNMQEMMAGNMRDMNVSFQNAESGLRIGESQVNTAALTSAFNGSGEWMDLQLPGADNAPVQEWKTADWTAGDNSIQTNISGLASQPRYVIEKIVSPIGKVAASEGSSIEVGSIVPEPEFFRITSYGTGATATAETVVQSTYKTLN